MRRLIREPLVHFVVLAALVFAINHWLSQVRAHEEATIRVSASEQDRLAALYAAEAGTLPSQQDMRAMISDYVEQKALVREARRLGLAEGDTVIERRLAQKMTFMISDMEEVTTPAPGELESWFAENQQDFEDPQRISFRHVFFAEADPERVDTTLQNLSQAPNTWPTFGDPFMLQRTYTNLPVREIARLFGAEFAASLATAPGETDVWQGPFESALGLHLVQILEVRDSSLPELDTIRDRVMDRWQQERSRELSRAAIDEIIAQYDVEIETPQ
ncbi:MAG: peptidyl-prolyl cis-trans isomerase [Henriciella sp.]